MPPQRSTVTVGGRTLTVSSLDKVMYPATGTTKGDVLEYYTTIAPWLIPHARWRPATRKRWVDGVGTPAHPGPVFFEKNLPTSAPAWVTRVTQAHSDRDVVYPVVNDVATLAWLAQIAALEIHVPQWRSGPRGKRKNPDRLVLDLDPGEGAGLAECAAVARAARALLQDLNLDALPVTSGNKGIHLYAGLPGTLTSEQVASVAHEIARALEAQHPDLVVSDMKKAQRRGKVLVDWSQNNAAKTTVCPYSLRGRDLPTVAAPRTWREIGSATLDQLTYDEVLRRVRRRGDLLAALADDADVEADGSDSSDSSDTSDADDADVTTDRLTTYRSKRDAHRTPEPVPTRRPSARAAGNTFVIQEHHARRLHWDFRLEHDGVLVSWALPKGVPTSSGQNHLAVQTEDHPMEYATFEGTIPAGEYGGGEVTVWDHGTIAVEKWRDGREVIATLHGQPDGGLGGRPQRYALIHTGRTEKDAKNWLIHLMSLTSNAIPVQPMLATPGAESDVSGTDWVLEMKWDGIRAICEVASGSVRLWSRNGNDVTVTFPDVVQALATAFPEGDVVVDGEIVAFDDAGRPSFGRLQNRLGIAADAAAAAAARQTPAHLLLFDILRVDGEDTTRLPYTRRRELLAEAVTENAVVVVPPAFHGDLGAAMASSATHGLEGVVAKRAGSTYRPGARSHEWVKIKHTRMQEVVVVGWQDGAGRRSGVAGSLLLAVNDDGGLRYVGKVGTGFRDRDLEEITTRLRRIARSTAPVDDVPAAIARAAHWVTPRLVGEVAFTEWTSAGNLRHPVWRGWRPDKDAAEVRVES